MSVFEKARDIITKPTEAFGQIKKETASIKDLYLKYALPLAAIPAIANFIGLSFIGNQFIRVSFLNSFLLAVISYLGNMLALYVIAFLVNLVLPNFSGKKDLTAVMKLMVYSATALWLAGFFSIIPQISIFTLLGLYSLYLLYVGVPILLDIPKEKSLILTILIVIIALVVMIVLGGLAAPLTISLVAPIY